MKPSLEELKRRLDNLERAIVRIDNEIKGLKDNREFMRRAANRLIDAIEAYKD